MAGDPEGYSRLKAPEDSIEAARQIKELYALTWGEFVYGAVDLYVREASHEKLYIFAVKHGIEDRQDMSTSELRDIVRRKLGIEYTVP